MRHWMLSLAVVSMLISMVGCMHSHSHGICDCEYDDHCSTRSPWIRMGGPLPEAVPAPKKLPDVKKL